MFNRENKNLAKELELVQKENQLLISAGTDLMVANKRLVVVNEKLHTAAEEAQRINNVLETDQGLLLGMLRAIHEHFTLDTGKEEEIRELLSAFFDENNLTLM